MVTVSVSPDLSGLVRLGVLTCRVTVPVEHESALDRALAGAAEAARRLDTPDLSAARDLYKAIRIDPTRTRPSSEALLRRVRRGEALPRVNTVVDIGNWCSLEFQLPYGVYDAGQVHPPVELRVGGAADGYPGIRKDHVHLGGRFALFDGVGPFGNPSSDSARTMVTAETRAVLVVVYAPARLTPAHIERVLDGTAARLAQFAGGTETSRQVV